jgi:hypothetical protein
MTREQAIRKARAIANERGWRWREPVYVTERRDMVAYGRRRIEVWSNAGSIGANVRVVFDAQTGKVLRAIWYCGSPKR